MTVRALLCLIAVAALAAGEARSAFFNQKVSAREVALNQPVRIELTTIPRQIEGVDIPAAVGDAITLTADASWRLVGKAAMQTDEKTKTIRISATLLPRRTGDLVIPTIPISWLNGEQIAEFGSVKVLPQLVVAGGVRPLPAELDAVGGYAWGGKLAELRDRMPPTTGDAERSVAKPQPGLELVFRKGELVEAAIDVADLNLDAARASFLDRWGQPQIEENGSITWILGWTRIAATPATDGKGVHLALAREDMVARITRSRIADKVFGLLEGPQVAKPAVPSPAPTPLEKPAAAPAEKPADPPAGK